LPLVSSRALILHVFPYGDTSKILRLLTPEHGLRSVIAKGAMSPKSRFGGVLEPFTEGEAQFYLRENRDLFTLSGFHLLRSRQAIGHDLAAFSGASLVAELCLRAATEEPAADLYEGVSQALDRLASPAETGVGAALAAVWTIVSRLGFRPQLQACVRCGRALRSEEETTLDVVAGGVACRDCEPVRRPLDAGVRGEIHRMAAGETVSPVAAGLRVHAAVLESYLGAHLAPDRALRSLPLFLDYVT
jgi:DNA repair protein RecO (recombination protein O)